MISPWIPLVINSVPSKPPFALGISQLAMMTGGQSPSSVFTWFTEKNIESFHDLLCFCILTKFLHGKKHEKTIKNMVTPQFIVFCIFFLGGYYCICFPARGCLRGSCLGHATGTDSLEVPTINKRTIFQEISGNIPRKYMP